MFAQNDEDSILARFFGDQSEGVYIDVGAFDGVTFSNTYLFDLRGWNGICIEPNPEPFAKLQQKRPRATCIQAAIVGNEHQKPVTLYLSKMPILATLTTEHADKIAIIHGNVGETFDGFTEIEVPSMNLVQAIGKSTWNGTIDLLSIDVEWTNNEVLYGFDILGYKPRVIVIETGGGVRETLDNVGYHFVAEHHSNLFYVRDVADIRRMKAAFGIPPKVAALVSTYNSADFLRGCIEDLQAQTLYKTGDLEIIVVNSGSKQHEAAILREYQGIEVITSLREPMYVALNRAIALSTGQYLTIANTDDRHAPHALERLAAELDNFPDVGLVYADCYVTSTPNAVWNGEYKISHEPPYISGRLGWPDFDPLLLTQFCFVGPQPMWRRELGGFDESYLLAGDYELALRLTSQGVQFKRVDEVLGIFYSNGMGINNQQQSGMESRRALLKHRQAIEERYHAKI